MDTSLPGDQGFDFDWIVVGSGFGASVSALRLSEKGYRVGVLEQGRRYADTDFAERASQLRRYVWLPSLGLRGILRIAPYRHAMVLAGVGVGGGSLVYANTMYQPQGDDFYRHPQWAELADWRAELEPHFRTASRMFGVEPYVGERPVDGLMRELATELGVPQGYRHTPTAVFLGEAGKTVPDPYFDGAGPARTGCVRCGQCMLGCRYGAKNSLPKNYLWLAESAGATVVSELKVVDIVPLGDGTGAQGYRVRAHRPGLVRGGAREFTARGVVVAAGALGTNELLAACKRRGSLPELSDRLGEVVRTNDESIPAASTADPAADYRSDIAITSSVFPDEHTHITNNTYGDGGGLLALTYGPATNASTALGRWAQFLCAYPGYLWGLLRNRRWSRRTVIFTVMRGTDVSLRLRRGFGPGRLQTEAVGAPPEGDSAVEIARRVATLAARRMNGQPLASLGETLGSAPMTAHFLGGAVIGADREHGVIDRQHRVFGYTNLLVCDGSAVPANVGVNPSLTICAMAEAAMAHVPHAAVTA
ncbi:GMC family oxidoreductase [Nocardia sp. CDC160]|uniref:GMC family oxidoreductase n=1 Tax=Nocardia sp. CDC160 TaxID=3112166 RepID=UPI002DB90EF4|nr:GMC family oxidoreductase [Nocardia sp. CDC160]MEC3919341.1 GMC family oxidoreductase [Nocardia sp. CDC160]